METIAYVWHRMRKYSQKFQVELQGHYSTERLRSLHEYSTSTTTLWAVTVSLITPFPCLLVLSLIDAIPLAHWERGLSENYVFWARDFLTIALMTWVILQQLCVVVPGLPMNTVHVVFMPLISSGGATVFMMSMSNVIGFPLPFALVVGITVWFAVLLACFAGFYGAALRRNQELFIELRNYTVVLILQVLLTFVYPTYLYGFLSVRANAQIFYFMVLPVIKLVARNLISAAITSKGDLKPQIVVFNVEVFNALYVATAAANSSSIVTMLQTIVLDIVLLCVSLVDIYSLMNDLDKLMLKIPVDHPLKSASFLKVALQILELDPEARDYLTRRRFSSILMQGSKYQVSAKKSTTPSHVGSGSRRIHSATCDACNPDPGSIPTFVEVPEEKDWPIASVSSKSLIDMFSCRERCHFVRRTAQVLFTTEFILLVEYVEIITPFIYGVYTTSMFILPNHDYYPLVSELDGADVAQELGILTTIGMLELLSLVVTILILRRKLRIWVFKILAFVLDRSRRMVQACLFLWICYIVQNSLDHNGADFSFQFAWLAATNTSTDGSS